MTAPSAMRDDLGDVGGRGDAEADAERLVGRLPD